MNATPTAQTPDHLRNAGNLPVLPTDLPETMREAELMTQVATLERRVQLLHAALNEAADLHDRRGFPVSFNSVPWWRPWKRYDDERAAQLRLAEIQRDKADEWYALLAATRL